MSRITITNDSDNPIGSCKTFLGASALSLWFSRSIWSVEQIILLMENQKNIVLSLPSDRIAEFCKRNHIRKLSLFGSFLHGNAKSDSDIDFLVEFDANHIPGLLGLSGMEIELTDLLGRKVDLRTPEDLSRYFRSEVLQAAQVQYAER